MEIKFKSFDDPFLFFKVEEVTYCWNPEYGSLLNLDTDKLEKPTEEITKFVHRYYSLRESMPPLIF